MDLASKACIQACSVSEVQLLRHHCPTITFSAQRYHHQNGKAPHLHQPSPQLITLPPSQVFIFGVNFPETRLVSSSLQTFYGIGPQIRTKLMAQFHIHKTAKIGSLNDKQINDLAAKLSTMTLENDLRRSIVENIKRLRDMGSYRGRRHAMGLPVRGQRTRTQIATARKLNRVERRV